MKRPEQREVEALVVALILAGRDGMKLVEEDLKDHQALEKQVLLVQAEGVMIHLDLAYPVTLHGKGLIDDQTVEIGDLAPVERMMMGGGYRGNGLLTDLINGEVVLQEGGHLGEEDQIHIEIEVLQMMSGRQHGAVDVLTMNLMMSGGAHQMNDFLNGVMMIAMILIPLVLLIHLEHLFHTRKKKETIVKVTENPTNIKKTQTDIKEVNRKVIDHKMKT